ncbi:hypothetical protein [Alicyclobacillus mengziensis]|uniref:Uncharacterized protein n=1 Tax=Alicyclobacillus mengziensis TaxID=2931921 RepID=A0A9X7Z7K3_9BACL|nr:hypothetical protein [Alicyclobacillus mengziensis]QSO47313.1 hypothetical protein JZ786_23485 [Alicyclobacillus mengziensis]
MLPEWSKRAYAWPKVWKRHATQGIANRIHETALVGLTKFRRQPITMTSVPGDFTPTVGAEAIASTCPVSFARRTQ